MIQALVGVAFIGMSVAGAAVMVWVLWVAGRGRHRAPRCSGALEAGPSPLAAPGAGDGPPTLVLLADADRADLDYCEAERRRRPHFFHADGSRTCCVCQTLTGGDL